jgi:NAD(P) transhydrogenase subunit alpha
MFSSNLYNLVEEFWNAEEKRIDLNLEDEIVKGCVITHQGEIVNEMIAKHYGKES